jgi:hypothetical protein
MVGDGREPIELDGSNSRKQRFCRHRVSKLM